MRAPKTSDVVFWLLAAATAAVLGLFALLLAGVLPLGEPKPAAEAPEARAQPRTASAPTDGETRAAAAGTTGADSGTRRVVVRPAATNVVVTAARGDCWISARIGSASGRVLEERLLLQGEVVRLRGPAVWLSLGAAAHVDVEVDGRPRTVPAGTVAVVFSPARTT
jgi:Domain of unknown function (DUF4115)